MTALQYTSGCRKSYEDVHAYPFTLSRTALSKRTLSVYRQTLSGCEASPYGVLDLFDREKNFIFTWDLLDSSSTWNTLKLEGTDAVRKAISFQKIEPICRFMFIHQRNSRSPLGCSREQLEHILTHYQVMAPFMENIFTFHDRQDAHLHASFRSEDYIWGQVPKPIVKGSRMQHCFNLIGLEYGFNAEKKTGTYYYRQTAAYFSLDLVSVQTVWLIIKGDRAIRESIQDFTEQLDPDIKQNSPEKAFLFALQLHLLIYEWAIQTWTPYIDSLQAKYVDISKVVAYTPVAKKTENAIIDQSVSRSISFNSNVLQAYRPRKRREMSWNKIVKRLGERTSKSPSSSTTPDTSQNLHPDISHTFSFDKLQMLHHEATKVQVGLSVLDQNKTVLQDMLKRFERLHQSEIFLQHVNIKQEEFQTFFHKTEHCIGELDHQHKRLSAIQEDLTGVISLFNGILQHYNTRIADSYARAAKVSTDSMRWLAVKTKQETVSIHIITILTLFFLPATFVATFFGSGVIDFEQGSEESKDRWGYWDVRWGALKFFGVFIGPLTGVVLAVWAVTYFKSWRRWRVTMDQNQMQGNGADV